MWAGGVATGDGGMEHSEQQRLQQPMFPLECDFAAGFDRSIPRAFSCRLGVDESMSFCFPIPQSFFPLDG